MKRINFGLLFVCALFIFPASGSADRSIPLLMGGAAHVRADENAVIPFELIGHLIVVKGRVNGSGQDYTFILDTGSLTAVTKDAARRLGLAKDAVCETSDATGAGKEVCLTRLKSISLGGLTAEGIAAAVFDPHIRQRAGIKVDGYIGSNFLRFFKVKIDYQRRLVTLSGNTAPLVPAPGETLVKIGQDWKTAFVPLVKVRCGDASFTASVDTGLYDPLSIPPAFLDKTDVEAAIDGNGAMGSGNFENIDKVRLVRLKGLRIGSREIGKVIATSQAGQTNALIGYGLLSNFVVTIDYPAEQVLLVPVKGGKRIDNLFSTGIAIGRDYAGRTLVSGTWDGSPARRMGIAQGDEITAVDGRPAGSFTLPRLQKLLFDDEIKSIDLSIKGPFGNKRFTIGKKCLFADETAAQANLQGSPAPGFGGAQSDGLCAGGERLSRPRTSAANP